jgi:hypothetical protein
VLPGLLNQLQAKIKSVLQIPHQIEIGDGGHARILRAARGPALPPSRAANSPNLLGLMHNNPARGIR